MILCAQNFIKTTRMEDLIKKIEDASNFIRAKSNFKPEVCIILGSGLAELVNQVKVNATIDYKDIPHFPVSTVIGHPGKLILGELSGKNVAVMQGRFHFYEGYTMQEVAFPTRVMKACGANTLIVTNAAGGLNPAIKVGELMIINDHINLQPENPLLGKNHDALGPRFPDQHAVYDKVLIEKAKSIAKKNNITCHEGVYVGVPGPTFETPAEYKYMRIIGGDAVGMSTVPEVIVGNHAGMKIFGVSVITDEGNPITPQKISHQEVVAAAKEAEPRMSLIIRELVAVL